MEDNILQKVTSAFSALSCIEGIVLGGSRATASFNQDSDIDIGLYYKPHCLDYDELNSIAKSLDDQHRNHLIGKGRRLGAMGKFWRVVADRWKGGRSYF